MREESGQAAVEWVALLALVTALLVAGAAVVDGSWLPRRLRCALLVHCRGEEAALEAAYGGEVARLVRAHVPNVAYEPGTLSLPVDFRRCRAERCADGPDRRGADVNRATRSGEQATLFTRVVDRRPDGGDLYIQYWMYYPSSTAELARLRRPLGIPGDHADDWESTQVRIRRDGAVFARASAHAGYRGRRSRAPNLNELPFEPVVTLPLGAGGVTVGRRRTAAWTGATGWTRVSRGSHAGQIPARVEAEERRTEANGIALVPLERLTAAERATTFAVSAPWRKRVWSDPEATGT